MNAAIPPLHQPHPGYSLLAEKVLEAGLGPADPVTQPLDVARCRAESYYHFLGGSPEPVKHIFDTTFPGPLGPNLLRIYQPESASPLPVALYFHGGGYALNSIGTHDTLLRRLANESGVAIGSLAYSKAPEARFPTQLDEARHLFDWLEREGPGLGLDTTRIVLSGDSAGAHLALTTALSLPEKSRKNLRGLALAYGMFEPSFDSASHRAYGRGYGLTSERMRWFWNHFLPHGQDRSAPCVAPLWADLAGLPPTLLLAAELDCLKDDSLHLAKRLNAAGVPTTLSVYPGMQHAFLMAPAWLPPADQAITEIAEALKFWLLA
jgi:acetyl esterase